MDIASMDGLYIVTGATGGIGGAIAERLVQEGAGRVMIACRNATRAATLAGELRRSYPSSPTVIETGTVDLASMESVRCFASRLEGRRIAALINNAGVMPGKIVLNADGIEMATATNAVGTALLTELLLPMMADGGAIVFTISVTRLMVRLRPDWISHAASYHGFLRRFKTYGRSKLVITHYAAHLAP